MNKLAEQLTKKFESWAEDHSETADKVLDRLENFFYGENSEDYREVFNSLSKRLVNAWVLLRAGRRAPDALRKLAAGEALTRRDVRVLANVVTGLAYFVAAEAESARRTISKFTDAADRLEDAHRAVREQARKDREKARAASPPPPTMFSEPRF